ncbi:hypothetical protein ACODT3_06660 [Streptomyces sp. 4.24]|uniref:hypothetical protein n=1 Tax=Streptomyces tritrimontium TaxID=3406573 RepID=UPI003BB682F3
MLLRGGGGGIGTGLAAGRAHGAGLRRQRAQEHQDEPEQLPGGPDRMPAAAVARTGTTASARNRTGLIPSTSRKAVSPAR